jgi:hypothetical protein
MPCNDLRLRINKKEMKSQEFFASIFFHINTHIYINARAV